MEEACTYLCLLDEVVHLLAGVELGCLHVGLPPVHATLGAQQLYTHTTLYWYKFDWRMRLFRFKVRLNICTSKVCLLLNLAIQSYPTIKVTIFFNTNNLITNCEDFMSIWPSLALWISKLCAAVRLPCHASWVSSWSRWSWGSGSSAVGWGWGRTHWRPAWCRALSAWCCACPSGHRGSQWWPGTCGASGHPAH